MAMQKKTIDRKAQFAAGGDSTALSELYDMYYPLILSYMHYKVHPDCAEDLTSKVFYRVVKGIAGLSGGFNCWIYTIARNVVVDHYRYNGKRSYVEYEDGVTVELDNPNYGNLSLFNTTLDLQEILSGLEEHERELLVLRFIQGFTSAEVAEIMGVSAVNVRVMQTRLLSRLRDEFRKEV